MHALDMHDSVPAGHAPQRPGRHERAVQRAGSRRSVAASALAAAAGLRVLNGNIDACSAGSPALGNGTGTGATAWGHR